MRNLEIVKKLMDPQLKYALSIWEGNLVKRRVKVKKSLFEAKKNFNYNSIHCLATKHVLLFFVFYIYQ